ncbi:MAG: UvrD-helicase domain-containing protein [Myxococcota bacterium]|nr:UvrD-helicase domain-containing protein [Myxococcota bacterium]
MKIDFSGTRPGFQLDDPGILLDEHQRKALAFDREILVSAGAGSGKTSTLSLRYTRLLVDCAWESAVNQQEECPIEQVLVLTFTDKAAQEMAERCERQLRNFTAAARQEAPAILSHWGAAQGSLFLAHLNSLVEQFNRARVSTFHSFYTTVLRENALRVGLNPGFRLAEDLERRDLLKDVVQHSFEVWRNDLSEETYRELARDLGGRRGIEEAANKLLRERSKFHGLTTSWGEPGMLLQKLQEEAPLSPQDLEAWLSEEIRPVICRLAEYLAPGGTAVSASVEQLARDLGDLPQDSIARNTIARRIFRDLYTRGKPRALSKPGCLGTVSKWNAQGNGHLYKDYKAAIESLQPSVASWAERRADVEALPIAADRRADRGSAALWSLYNRCSVELAKTFQSQQLEDFDGLELRVAAQLAEDVEFRNTLSKSVRYIMVDEFQDTNALQWGILKHIARPNGEPTDRLFAVGDLKQAIYSFRGGDVTVFTEAMGSIQEQVELKYNYRSTPNLVNFTNTLFQTLMGDSSRERLPWEAYYTNVEAGRKWDHDGEIAAWSYDSTSAKENARIEASWIAERCALLLDEKGPYKDHCFGSPSAHPESPIAILLRRRTHLQAYQEALSEAGISYRVVKGVGFWRRREVLDLQLALQACVRQDTKSLIGFLRSPFACVTDPDIQRLSRGDFGALPRDFLQGDLSNTAPEELALAHSNLRTLAEAAPTRSLRSLAEEAIRICVAPHAWIEHGDPSESEANVLKFLQLCSEYGNRGWSHGRILEVFERESQNRVDEREADVSGSSARVLIQTVHSAKGLEFPVVFLPALGHETPITESVAIGRANHAWTAAYKVHDPEAPTQTKTSPVRHLQISDRRKSEERAESLRKLYVAVTRAESHLYFVGAFEKPTANSWASLIQPSLGTPWGPQLITEETCPPPEDRNPCGTDETLAVPMGPYRPIPWLPEIRVTPSSIRLYKTCPLKWRLAQTYGVQPGLDSHRESTREAAARRGDLLHELLERRQLDPERAVQRWRSMTTMEPWPDTVCQQQEKRLLADLKTLSDSTELAHMFQGEAHAEPGFEVTHGTICLHGRVDLIWRDGEQWVLSDFKSEDLQRSKDMEREHRDQLTAYAWASSRLLGEPVNRVELFGTRDGRRYPVKDLEAEDFSAFEALLESIERDFSIPLQQLEVKVLAEKRALPCDTCSYRNTLCKGQKRT